MNVREGEESRDVVHVSQELNSASEPSRLDGLHESTGERVLPLVVPRDQEPHSGSIPAQPESHLDEHVHAFVLVELPHVGHRPPLERIGGEVHQRLVALGRRGHATDGEPRRALRGRIVDHTDGGRVGSGL